MNKPLIRFAVFALVVSLGIGTAYAGARGGGTRISAGKSRPVSNGAVVKPNPGPPPTPTPNPRPQPQPQPKPQPQQSTTRSSSIIGSLGSGGSMIGSLGSGGSMIGSLGAGGNSSIIGNTTPAVAPVPGPNPAPGPNPKPKPKPNPGPNPGPGPKPRPNNEVVGVSYYDTGVGVEVGVPQVESAAATVAPQVEQALQDMPSSEQIQDMARQLQGPVTQQVNQAMQNMPSADQIQQMARQLQGPVTQQVEQAVQQLPQPMQEKLNEPIVILPRSVNAGNGSRTRRSNANSTYGIPGMSGGNGNGPLIYNP